MTATPVVLAALDFDRDDWRRTVAHGARQARRRGGRLHLVHVLAPLPWLLARVLDEDSLQAQRDARRQRAEALLAEAAGLAGGVPVSDALRRGKPAVEILDEIGKQQAELLVIDVGSPRTTELLVGGTADRLLRLSPVPIWVTGPHPPGPVHRVLVPTGLGPSGQFAVQTGVGLVEPGGEGGVTALHMVALPGVLRAYSGDVTRLRAALEAEARGQLDAHLAPIRVPQDGPALEGRLVANLETTPAESTILNHARDRSVDLICLALGGRKLPAGPVLGRVSERVIRSLPCPLLALPDRWVDAQRQ